MRVRSLGPGRDAFVDLETDGEGLVQVPLAEDGAEVWVKPGSVYCEVTGWEPAGAVASIGQGRAVLLPGAGEVVARLECQGTRMRVVDAETGAPVTAEAYVGYEFYSSSPVASWKGMSPPNAEAFDPKRWSIEAGSLDWVPVRGPYDDGRLAIWADGYDLYLRDNPREVFGAVGRVLEVRLMPRQRPAKFLRVRFADGEAYRGRLWIVDGAGERPIWEGPTDGWGQLGPVAGLGGDWRILDSGRGIELATLKEPEARAESTLEVVLPLRAGSLVIAGAPEASAAVRVLREGARRPLEASAWTAEGLRFDGLQPGHYLIGPGPWLDQESYRSMYPGFGWDVQVVGGKTATVAWNEAWWPEDSIEGQVEGLDSSLVGSLALVPVYRSLEMPARVSPLAPRVRIDGLGRYTLVGMGRPERLLLIRLRAGDTPTVLAGFHPGGRTAVDLGRVVVHVTSTGTEPIQVSYRVPAASIGVPVAGADAFSGYFAPGETISLDLVPRSVDTLTVKQGGAEVRCSLEWGKGPDLDVNAGL
ncbi:MAG TPA: hypothetical protein PLJ12_09895 [Planctomycetota bacterium]|nr:hypothetical protein [Planctomycetota bacterium]